EKSDLRIGHVERFHTAEPLDVFRVLLDEGVDDVVDRDDALDHAITIHDGNSDEIVFANQLRYFFTVGGEGNRLHLLPGDIRHLPAFRRGEQLAQRHHALHASGGIG